MVTVLSLSRLLSLSSLILLLSCLFFFFFFSSPMPTATCTKRKQRRHSPVNTFPRFAETADRFTGRQATRLWSTTINVFVFHREILKARQKRETSFERRTQYFWPFRSENVPSLLVKPSSSGQWDILLQISMRTKVDRVVRFER